MVLRFGVVNVGGSIPDDLAGRHFPLRRDRDLLSTWHPRRTPTRELGNSEPRKHRELKGIRQHRSLNHEWIRSALGMSAVNRLSAEEERVGRGGGERYERRRDRDFASSRMLVDCGAAVATPASGIAWNTIAPST